MILMIVVTMIHITLVYHSWEHMNSITKKNVSGSTMHCQQSYLPFFKIRYRDATTRWKGKTLRIESVAKSSMGASPQCCSTFAVSDDEHISSQISGSDKVMLCKGSSSVVEQYQCLETVFGLHLRTLRSTLMQIECQSER